MGNLNLKKKLKCEKRPNKYATNFSHQDKTWAKFSTLEVAGCVLCDYAPKKQNGLT